MKNDRTCSICEQKISNHNKSGLCRSCVNKGSRNPHYKENTPYRKKYFCGECNKPISVMCGVHGSGFCRRCSSKRGAQWVRSEAELKRMSEAMKKVWQNPEFRSKMNLIRKKQMTPEVRTKICVSLAKRNITGLEFFLIKIIEKNNLPFKFVGNGEFIVSGFNPDFVNKDNTHLIEVFYTYFKEKTYGSVEKYKQQRFAIFRKHGFNTLFFTEHDLHFSKEREIVGKINAFLEEKKN